MISHSPKWRRLLFKPLRCGEFIAVAWISLTATSLFADTVPAASWKAGTAKEVITPENAVWLAGYGTQRVPDGKLHDIWMKVLALVDSQGNRVVLVTSDFQGVPRSMSDLVFEQVKENFGLERDQIMITFSHNHCGPRLGDDLIDYYPVDADQEGLVAAYTRTMVDKMVALIGKALESLQPAEISVGRGVCTFAVNRRNNREADVPALLQQGQRLAGPVDHDVPVMAVRRKDGTLMAILFGYACHPTTLNFLKWCGDYPGFAQLKIEESHPEAIAMFVNTCGGDQNPIPRRSVQLCKEYGDQLAASVENVLVQPLLPVSPTLKFSFAYVELPYLSVVTREDLEREAASSGVIRSRWARRLLNRLDAGDKFESAYPYPVHVWKLGTDILMIGQGAETVVDYALRYKIEYGQNTWVMGYADDMIAYIPSERVWVEGGYEGGANLFEYGRPAFRWSSGIEELIAATVDRLVTQVNQDD
ncbi:neutral/alkaline non-lysosomal ceramidase N-terminal domain-containing protein [Planctomicrobium sp. SH661]|uniref:neutral/alkaline non-lysosomal ceramidase N-terminal domain-containing protein n=1 Tax=Planctomicrobium sp. SH661 TaxID=3448124 RepID=UPI003F5BFA10